jgi:hypothetical protein
MLLTNVLINAFNQWACENVGFYCGMAQLARCVWNSVGRLTGTLAIIAAAFAWR